MQQPNRGGRGRTGLIIGIVATGLVITMVVVWLLSRGGSPTITASSASASPSPTEASPSEIVELYFAALPTGDKEALAEISADGGTALEGLTSEAIAAAAKAGPVTNLVVTDSSSSYVKASYTIDGEATTGDFLMTNTSDGWKIENMVAEVSMPTISLPKGVKVTANGLEGDSFELTPGVWELGTTNKFITLSRDSIAVNNLNSLAMADLSADLTKDGVKAIRSAIKSGLKKCESDPYGCGMLLSEKVSGGGSVAKKTMKCSRTSSSESVDDIDISLSYGSIDIFTSQSFDCEGEDTKGNSIGGTGYIYNITADISNPDKVTASFED